MRPWLLCVLCFAYCAVSLRAAGEPPAAPREFRAVWVATLDNIDWPSRSGLSTEQQRQEVLLILDRVVELHLNVVILQVRSAADAIYPSQLEPWSRCLTGVQGQAPEPLWDPLQFWIEQAHQRGLELHAWLNPCRAHTGRGALSESHIARRRPELVCRYGDLLWLDPGRSETTQHTLTVVSDLLRRYTMSMACMWMITFIRIQWSSREGGHCLSRTMIRGCCGRSQNLSSLGQTGVAVT